MNMQVLKYSILFVCLVAAQVLICNRIVLFDVAIPVIFIYFIIRLPIDLSLNLTLTLAFFMGLTVDVFSDTLGVNALSCTIIAALRRPIYYLYLPKDDKTKEEIPTMSTIGPAAFSKFTLTICGIYCFLLFMFDFFSLAEIGNILIMTLASTVFSFPLLLCIDSLVPGKKSFM